jgi:hypothetical protein
LPFCVGEDDDGHNINRAVRPRISPITRDEFGSILAANAAKYAGFAGSTGSEPLYPQ